MWKYKAEVQFERPGQGSTMDISTHFMLPASKKYPYMFQSQLGSFS
jgi:hypothetical protein